MISSFLQSTGPTSMALIIGLTSWAIETRILRGQALSLRNRDFILAAKVAGESTPRIVFGELMPNMLSRIAAGFAFVFVQAVFYEAALEFLGFGDANKVSWGTTLFWATNNSTLLPGRVVALRLPRPCDLADDPRDRLHQLRDRRAERPAAASSRTPNPSSLRRNPVAEDRQHDRRGQGAAVTPSTGSAREPLVEIEDLVVDYPVADGSVRAVDGVSLAIHPGEIVGLAGESGCGKSTVAHSILRILRPPGHISGGRILFRGQDVLALSTSRLRRFRWRNVSIVFQSAMNSLNPVMRIGDQFVDMFKAHERVRKAEALGRSGELLELVGIDPARLRAYPHELSGGMRQRVVIAMALALNPELLIMDEPTTALDVVVQREILREIEDAAAGARLRRSLHHARPLAARRVQRSDRDHVRGQDRRARVRRVASSTVRCIRTRSGSCSRSRRSRARGAGFSGFPGHRQTCVSHHRAAASTRAVHARRRSAR